MKLKHKIEGNGEKKVIVLHDLGGDHGNYDPMLPYLDRETFTYTFIDFRGYGMSKGVKGEYSLEEVVGDLIETVDWLGYDQFHIVCHSMSGMIAQKLALEAPGKVESIVAIAPILASGFPMDKETKQYLLGSFQSEEMIYEMLRNFWTFSVTDMWYKYKAKKWWECSDTEAVCGYFEMITTNNFEEEAKELEVPHLIVTGEHDAEIHTEAFFRKSFAGSLPDVKIQTIGSASHYPMIETPVMLVSMIEEYIKTGTVVTNGALAL